MTQPRFITVDPRFETFVDTSSRPNVIAEGYTWAEGPVWLDDQLFFNDVPNKKMWCWDETTGANIALSNSEFANGNTLDLDGQMVSCEHGGRRVIRRLDPMGADDVEVIAESYQGQRLNSPNDVIVRSDGSVWFTDPPYGITSDIEGYQAESEIGGCYVFCSLSDGSIHAVAKDFDKPNGMAFSPDERRLYVADSGAILGAGILGVDYDRPHHIRVFDVEGITLSNSRVFAVIAPGVPDGLRVDHEGFVWTSAHDGIHCLSPEGALMGKIYLPQPTSNICFGGEKGQTLFITSSDKVYRVESTRRDAAHVRRERQLNLP